MNIINFQKGQRVGGGYSDQHGQPIDRLQAQSNSIDG